MSKYIIVIFICVLIVSCGSSKRIVKKSTEPKQYLVIKDEKERNMIIGEALWDQWQEDANWEEYTADSYNLDSSSVLQLKAMIIKKNINFLIFAGSWCGDSKTELPKIIKIFETAGVERKDFTLFGVDHDKIEPTQNSIKYNIEKVPTLIVLSNGNEIGRIVEFPKKAWIVDILQIINEVK